VKEYRKQANNLTSLEAAYIAGLVDGEGCIYACSRRSSIEGGLSLGSTNRDVLVYLRNVSGVGSVTPEDKGKKRKKNHRPIYVWTVTVASVRSLLIQLEPHLKIKKPQATLLIKLFGMSKYPSKIVDHPSQFKLVEQFRSLNMRGELTTTE